MTEKSQPIPFTYPPETKHEFLSRMALGRTIKSVSSDEDMPTSQTIWVWRQEDPEFDRKVSVARKCLAEMLVDEALQIADENGEDWIKQTRFTLTGEEYSVDIPNFIKLQRDRVRIHQRNLMAARFNRELFGERDKDTEGTQDNTQKILSEKPLDDKQWEEKYGADE